jgi:hypothetical protein
LGCSFDFGVAGRTRQPSRKNKRLSNFVLSIVYFAATMAA